MRQQTTTHYYKVGKSGIAGGKIIVIQHDPHTKREYGSVSGDVAAGVSANMLYPARLEDARTGRYSMCYTEQQAAREIAYMTSD